MDWRVKLASALAVDGYATADLRSVAFTPIVPLSSALTYARGQYIAQQSSWDEFSRHLLSLKVLGIQTIAMKAREGSLSIILGRVPPDGMLELNEVVAYAYAIEQWLARAHELIPHVKVHSGAADVVKNVAGWVGTYTGQADIVSMAGRLIATLIQVGGEGGCTTIHPVNSASPSYAASWKQTDLADAPFLTPTGYFSANLLWALDSGALIPSGFTGWSESAAFYPKPAKIQTLLTAVV